MAIKEIREGMTVISSDGEKLGKVIGREREALVVEKGFFFPRDYLCSLSDVRDVRGEEIILARSKAELERGMDTRSGQTTEALNSDMGAAQTSELGTGQTLGSGQRSNLGAPQMTQTQTSGDMRVPIVEEQLDVQKKMRQAGEVQIRKEVVTEEKHITVPVMKETVTVERVPASASAQASGRFENETVRIPVMEEEVQVTKRPVVKEELRISTEAHTENREVEETVRRERAKVDRGSGSGELRANADDDDPLTRR